ncbi:MAG: PolC-type DNA polymerase III [Ruminococcaceae bacterium]|nr:PolC-type DNA polymerase III [Oscillospiraceae bacterium]
MRPSIDALFPAVRNSELAQKRVEKIKLSKSRRRMEVLLEEDASEEALERFEFQLQKTYRLSSVHVHKPGPVESTPWKLLLPEEFEAVEQPEAREEQKPVVDLGRAVVTEMLFGSAIRDELVPISAIGENSGRVCFYGEVFGLETKDITSKKTEKQYHIVMIDVTDYQDSVSVQMFMEFSEENDATLADMLKRLKNGTRVAIRGKAEYNQYAREVIVSANAIGLAPPAEVREDTSEEKRVELHMHTQMSAMDAVSSTKDLIERAISWGHKAIAITDHGVVQSYPDAMKASDNNEKIKVLYGVEGYLLDDSAKISYRMQNQTVADSFVVFDIETTGLSNTKNNITEIGAVKVEQGEITERWSTFVNPCEPIPANIVELTGITDEMVADAPKIEEILGDFLEFCKGCVLVAHNARFDVGFIQKAADKHGFVFENSYLDTLQLARCLYPEFPNHKLDTLSKHLKILLENHHRAVDDAKATADIFVKMLEELKSREQTGLAELNTVYDMAEASKKGKAYHIILLAKNETGVRNIYEMVSASHLKYFFRTPRIPKSMLARKREGIIVGSACEAGELFRAIVDHKPLEELKEIASFYDYLEIQPIGNNAYMKREADYPDVQTDEDLQNLNRKVVELGELMGKPVCATCDVHFLDPEGANYRKILMYYKGFKDAVNQAPLYLRTTGEMLSEFAYLGEEKAYEVVVTNTNLIAEQIEAVRPIPKKKCPPEIEGAQESIIADSYSKARAIYGENLPKLVQERLDKELYSITTYGFSVMYKIAQELVRKSLSDGYLVGSRGSVGSSFVAFLSDITEVNSLPAHYICPNCKNCEFIEDGSGISGCDLPDKDCPVCGTKYKKDGHDIPFETFLGFKGDKEPDIDLNFSGDYQPVIHKYTETFFGEGHVFRAGTIGTVAEKTAFGYVKKFAEENGITIRNAEMKRLAAGCVGVKRTSGQHPGGIIVVPLKNDIHEFCPVQHPADDTESDIITTHFDYHSIDQNLLKLDELGHDDPTVIRMLQDLTGLDPQTIPLDDAETMSLFTSTDALKITEDIGSPVGTYGVPEFGTKFVRQMLLDTTPKKFSELVRISGLSHGTDVWLNNAQDYIKAGVITLSQAICTRDDIMTYLIHKKLDPSMAFKIMEFVRKGQAAKKGMLPEYEEAMRENDVPDWYIESCKKIKYMFPKAHAVAYVTMAFRIAYYKVHYPEAFYIAYFTVRADDFDAALMARGMKVARESMEMLLEKKKNNTISPKEENLIPILEICIEMYARGINFVPVDLYESEALQFKSTPEGIRPPLNALNGMGENAAKSIAEARENGPFRTIRDLQNRTAVSKTVIELLAENGCLDGLPEEDQVDMFSGLY